MTIQGYPGKWLMFTGGGVFSPILADTLPENFTFEFDLLPAGRPADHT